MNTDAPQGIDYPEPPSAGERMHDDSIEQMLMEEQST